MPQAQTVTQPPRLPLVLQPENRDDTTAKDAKLINCFVEKGPKEDEYHVYKRPGLEVLGATLTGAGFGIYNWEGDVYSIFADKLYKNGIAVTGTVNTTNGVYKFSSCLGTTKKLQLGNGIATYNYDDTNGLVLIDPGTQPNFPTVCVKGIVYLDGTTYVMDADASIRGCTSLNDPATWTDILNTLTAQIEPDGAVALAKQLVYVLALGQWSTEVFYDAQFSTASPLGPVQGAKVNYGCRTAESVQDIDGILFWIATNRGAAPQVVQLESLKAAVISTKAIDRILSTVDYTTVFSFGLKYQGHRFYGITFKESNITLVYDLAEKLWAQWTDTNGNYWPIVSTTFNDLLGPLLQHESNGKIYTIAESVVVDDGELITCDLITPNFDGGTRRRKTLSMIEFLGDRVVDCILSVRFNDYDYDPTKWTNYRSVNMNSLKPILENNGTFTRRAYHIRHRAATRMRLEALELQMDIGTL